MRFEFATAGRIVFGAGVIAEAGELAAGLGRRPLIVSGRSFAGGSVLLEGLTAQGLAWTSFTIGGEPDVATIRAGAAAARDAGCDSVIAVGGGSALDSGKAIAALLVNPGDMMDYLEVVGAGQPLARPAAPLLAIPTTAGTGAEVTRNAVLYVPEQRVKVSMRSPHMLPRVALVDPQLTYDLPPAVTASSGMDALVQLVEPYLSIRANPLTDGLCREGMARAARSLRRAYEHGDDTAAREDMALASLLGGLALANAGLGVVHGFAGVIGGMSGAPHGAVCARLLAPALGANARALAGRAPSSPALARMAEVASILTGQADARLEDGIAWVEVLCADLAIPRLAALGLADADRAQVVEKTLAASSTKANPIPLTAEELDGILMAAW